MKHDDEKENQSVLNHFDFAAIEEMDPSLGNLLLWKIYVCIAEGHRVVYDREVPFELRIHDGEGGP